MSDHDGGSALTPQQPGGEPDDSAITPVAEGDSRAIERFSSGPRAHTVGLTEARTAQIVRQSGNARNVVFLAILVIALFIPVYWFYESGIPAVGATGRLDKEIEVQYVSDIARGYELYLANCARCHGAEGKGGIGPPLNDQMKLYNVLTATRESGTGHLNPDYINNVMTVGGRYICGDPNSLMDAWQEPNGPLNYRQVEELTAWLTASSEIVFERHIASHGEDAEQAEPEFVQGWRDPNFAPEPGATPPPSCWRNPSGTIGGSAPAATPAPDPNVTPEPVTGGTADAPRVINMNATASLQFTDEAGNQIGQISAVAGETIEFVIDNTAGFDHNLFVGTQEQLQVPSGTTDVGIPTWQSGEQTLTWTVSAGDAPLQFACTVPGHYGTMHGDVVIQN